MYQSVSLKKHKIFLHYNYICLKGRQTGSTLIGRINCIEYKQDGPAVFSVLRIPLFALVDYLPQALNHRETVFKSFNNLPAGLASTTLDLTSTIKPLTAQLWISVSYMKNGTAAAFYRLMHPFFREKYREDLNKGHIGLKPVSALFPEENVQISLI